MTSAGGSRLEGIQSLSGATPEDLNAVAAAGTMEELETALLELDRQCRQRRSEKLGRDASQWSLLRGRYLLGGGGELAAEEGPAEGAREEAAAQAATAADPGGKSSHSITLEEFQQKIVWERWTGNCSCPAESEHLLYPVDPSVTGQDISMVKPSAWLLAQSSRKQKHSSWVQSKQRRGDAAENLSFVDFLKSLPVFHSVRVADLADMERDCPSEAYRCGIPGDVFILCLPCVHRVFIVCLSCICCVYITLFPWLDLTRLRSATGTTSWCWRRTHGRTRCTSSGRAASAATNAGRTPSTSRAETTLGSAR